ncbi:hypothetical protein V8E51_005522 [Hyaloscypha variabilis]
MPGKAKNAENRSVEKGPAEELGMLLTVEQIAKLNHHRSILHGSKARIWQKYIFKRCAKRQVAIEQDVTMYNLIGQTRTFFVEEGDADKKVYASLLRALELWVSLIVAGKLHLVFQHEDYKSSRVRIKDWKKESMDNVRYALYQVVLKAREEASAGECAGIRPIEKEDTDMHDLSVKFEVSDAPEDLYRASPRPATRASRNILRSDEMTASHTNFSSTPSPAVSRFGNARYALRSNPQPVIDGGSCLDRLPAKIQQFRTELKEKRAAKLELKEAEEDVKKYQERIEKFNRLMELARELDED